MPALISSDGRWWWDGTQWRSRLVEGELDLMWYTSSPEWVNRILITGLIGLIPFVGSIVLIGWTLTATDMIGRRWRELPPAGFQYLERGVNPFIVSLVYGLVVAFVIVVGVFIGAAFLFANPPRVGPAIIVGLALFVFLLCWWLAWLYALAAVLIGADRLGIVKALDPRTLLRLARANPEPSLHVGLIIGIGSLALGIGGAAVGAVVPFGGLVVAIALPAVYAMAVPHLSRFRVES